MPCKGWANYFKKLAMVALLWGPARMKKATKAAGVYALQQGQVPSKGLAPPEVSWATNRLGSRMVGRALWVMLLLLGHTGFGWWPSEQGTEAWLVSSPSQNKQSSHGGWVALSNCFSSAIICQGLGCRGQRDSDRDMSLHLNLRLKLRHSHECCPLRQSLGGICFKHAPGLLEILSGKMGPS